MLDKGKIIKDISLLYELSLAVGGSLDFHENCDKFTTILMARKRLAIASVWVEDGKGGFKLGYASPKSRILERQCQDTAFIMDSLAKKPYLRCCFGEADFDKLAQESDLEGACHAIFSLKDFGFFKITTFKEGGFELMELNQLSNVIKKFAVSLEGCLSHERLKLETQRRIKAQKAEQQFLATMSHEIRNPMHAVIAGIDMLYETSPSPTQAEHLSSLRHSSQLLLSLLDNILDLSKIEAGELTFEEKKFDLAYLLTGISQVYGNKARKKGIQLNTDHRHNIKELIIGDPTRLSQILGNLMSNAVKFTKAGKVGFSSRLVRREGGEALVEFVVTDTGVGIAEDKIGRIFDKFKQAESGMTRRFGGTGLGLAIVKELVQHMRGRIDIESQPDVGTTIKVLLPFPLSGQPIKGISAVGKVAPTKDSLRDKRVLVVEDDPFNRRIISLMLKNWGCHFDTAENGKAALDLFNIGTYDFVLMDIHMPVMDGIQTTHHIRKSSDLPIIAMTASALDEERKQAFKAGMNAYVTKPFSASALLKEIQIICDF